MDIEDSRPPRIETLISLKRTNTVFSIVAGVVFCLLLGCRGSGSTTSSVTGDPVIEPTSEPTDLEGFLCPLLGGHHSFYFPIVNFQLENFYYIILILANIQQKRDSKIPEAFRHSLQALFGEWIGNVNCY